MSQDQTAAAIIPTFRRWEYLVSTVKRLLVQSRLPDEIIIVDQTPGNEIDARQKQIIKRLPRNDVRIVYVHQDFPHVYQARNAAANIAMSDLLLYLDDDVQFGTDFVETHLANLADPRIDAVVGRVVTRGVDRSRLPYPPRKMSATQRAFTFGSYRDDVRLEGISYLVAGNVCIRREALTAVGGWDEHILTYGDKDMGLRLHAAKKMIVYDPNARLVHLVAPAGGTRLSDPAAPWRAWQRAASIMYVAFRHLRGRDMLKFGFYRAAQHTILLRRNATRPTRWLPELCGFFKGWALAWFWARCGVVSSLECGSVSEATHQTDCSSRVQSTCSAAVNSDGGSKTRQAVSAN